MRYLARILSIAREAAQQVGPYLALEILLPGGTLIALLLFLYRQRAARALAEGRPVQLGVFALPWLVWARCTRALAWLEHCLRRRAGSLVAGTAAQ